jgi:hypothetical protein
LHSAAAGRGAASDAASAVARCEATIGERMAG